ncbi:hypothetical protein MMC34_005076 [Xylographa carneopallida]|nr:hypothetical protein [Xylographa carneopallida]
MGPGSLIPTWYGHVASCLDSLVLFESCLKGDLRHVPRRPHDRERSQLIKSGSVFIYEENASGIKRWTDGVPWSPSRILGNFLVYRELSKPFPPGEKKRATKRNKRVARPGEPYPRAEGETAGPSSPTTPGARSENGSAEGKEAERALIGSLVDSYGFKPDGLVKKTMSVTVQGVHHHLVSYYKIEDVIGGKLKPVSMDLTLSNIIPRLELTTRQNFRAPLDDENGDVQDNHDDQQIQYYQAQYPHDPRQFLSHAPHAHQPLQIEGPAYSSTSYNSSAHLPPNLYGSYSQASQPSFYSTHQQTAHQPMNAYSQASYTTQYPTHPQSQALSTIVKSERSPSYQQQQTPNYRQNSAPGIENRLLELTPSNGGQEQASRDLTTWSRNSGPYAPTSTQSPLTAAPGYSYPNNGPSANGSHMGMPPPAQSQAIVRNGHVWSESWHVNNHGVTPHPQSYPTQHS